MPTMRIEICGGIAAGKTTLATKLALRGFIPSYEDFRQNPFWKKFYSNPALYVREKNVCFLAQHVGSIKDQLTKNIVCDYAVFQDLSYANLICDREHRTMMRGLYRHLYSKLPRVSLVISLICDPRIQLVRIRKRGRDEEKHIELSYLEALNTEISKSSKMMSRTTPIIKLRSDEIDFASDEEAVKLLRSKIRAKLYERSMV